MGFRQSKVRSRVYPTGENHPRWQGGVREKVCQHCGRPFSIRDNQPITTFKKQKFCSKACADVGGIRYSGKDNVRYKEDALRRGRGMPHFRWAQAVLSRDGWKCTKCGADKKELHAHHIKPYLDYPDLRFDVSNGITLCCDCHWNLHAALKAKAVNSGNTLTDKAEGNPEPILRGNLLEGVTTRGRAYRQWVGKCDWCAVDIRKTLSDVTGKQALFCSRSCASKWRVANGKAFGPRQ